VSILTQPAVSRNFEEIGTLSWIRNQDTAKQIAGVRCDIFGKGQGCGDDVLVQKVDIVTLWVSRIVIEGQIARKHSVLPSVNGA